MKLINVLSATNKQLDWLVAKIEGRVLREPVYATHADVENRTVPFTMFEVNYFSHDHNDEVYKAEVSPIVVTRYGVAPGCSLPSIDFTDSKRRDAKWSVKNYFVSKEEAQLEADAALAGGVEDYHPTTDPVEAYKIILRERICVNAYLKVEEGWNACTYPERSRKFHVNGEAPFVAAMRCYITSKVGPTAEVPDEIN